MKCRGCEGGKAMLLDGKVVYSNCEHCDAMLALKDGTYEHYGQTIIVKGRKLGFIDNIESAYKLCSCFASNHQGKGIEPSKQFLKANEMAMEYNKKEDDVKQESLNKYEEIKEEAKKYYEDRKKQLKKLDEDNGGVPIT